MWHVHALSMYANCRREGYNDDERGMMVYEGLDTSFMQCTICSRALSLVVSEFADHSARRHQQTTRIERGADSLIQGCWVWMGTTERGEERGGHVLNWMERWVWSVHGYARRQLV